jgi:hypothetical protein
MPSYDMADKSNEGPKVWQEYLRPSEYLTKTGKEEKLISHREVRLSKLVFLQNKQF